MAEKDKKTFKEQLEDPIFKAIGGLDFWSIDLSPTKTFEKIQEAKEKEKKLEEAETAIHQLPRGSKGYKEAIID